MYSVSLFYQTLTEQLDLESLITPKGEFLIDTIRINNHELFNQTLLSSLSTKDL